MTRFATLLLGLCALAGAARAADDVKYAVHDGHFEKNTSGLTGEASFLAFADRAAFDKVFGAGFVMGKRPNVVPADAFKERVVVAVIHRGDAVWEYKPGKMTADKGVLTLEYEAKPKAAGGGGARYASPMILSLDKGEYKEIVFVENGKKAGTAKLEKK